MFLGFEFSREFKQDTFYTCIEAIKEGWFERFKGARPETVTVAYDPRIADYIYLRPSENLKQYWVCDLTDRSRRFRGHSFWYVWSQTKEEKKTNAEVKLGSTLAKGRLKHKLEELNKESAELQPDTSHLSNKQRVANISGNKEAEKEIERQKTAFKLKDVENQEKAKVIPIQGNEKEDYGYPDMVDDLFGDDDE